jgi:hypothetical protein
MATDKKLAKPTKPAGHLRVSESTLKAAQEWRERLFMMSRATIVDIRPEEAAALAKVLDELLRVVKEHAE